MGSQSPILDSMSAPSSDRDSTSPSLSLISTDVFNRLQAFQVYLEMSGTIDALTESIDQMYDSDSKGFSSILEHFKFILCSKLPQTVEAICLQAEIDELKERIEKLKQHNR